MANTDVINTIISMCQDYFSYMLPVIAVLAGIVFIVNFLLYVTIGLGKHTFKG